MRLDRLCIFVSMKPSRTKVRDKEDPGNCDGRRENQALQEIESYFRLNSIEAKEEGKAPNADK